MDYNRVGNFEADYRTRVPIDPVFPDTLIDHTTNFDDRRRGLLTRWRLPAFYFFPSPVVDWEPSFLAAAVPAG